MEKDFTLSTGGVIKVRGLKRKEIRELRALGYKIEALIGLNPNDLSEEKRDTMFGLNDNVLILVLGQSVADELLEGDAMKVFNEILSQTYPSEVAQKN